MKKKKPTPVPPTGSLWTTITSTSESVTLSVEHPDRLPREKAIELPPGTLLLVLDSITDSSSLQVKWIHGLTPLGTGWLDLDWWTHMGPNDPPMLERIDALSSTNP